MNSKQRKKHNRIVKIVAAILIAMCLLFIALILRAAETQSYLVVFVVAFIVAIVIIFFTAKDMLK